MQSLHRKNKANGFTLIELLVVIAIIGILSSLVLASLYTAQSKARDTTRAMSMRQLQNALEIYYNSNNAYPVTNNNWWGDNTFGGNHGITGPNGYIPGLAPTYIGALPLDPLNNTGYWNGYLYKSNGKSYKLLDHISPESYPSSGEAFYDPVRPTWAWMLCSGKSACNNW